MKAKYLVIAAALAAFLSSSNIAVAQAVTGDGRPCYTGPRGGSYAVNSHGNKDYSACIDYSELRPTAPVVDERSFGPRSLAPTCYVGPRGGTYTITASGRKNYSGC